MIVGFRFQKRIGIVPGLRLNLSKSGASVSLGERGAHLTIGKTPRVTVGIPGSGMSWTETMPHGQRQGTGGPLAFTVRALALVLGIGIGLAILELIVAAYGGWRR